MTYSLSTTFTNPSSGYRDYFGIPLAAVGPDNVLIGARYDGAGADVGVTSLFSNCGVLLTIFTNPSPAVGDFFGYSVAAIESDKVIIGAPYDDTGAYDAGAAYLFSTNGALLTVFTNPAPAGSDYFGWSVAAVGLDKVIVGAYADNAFTGAAYLFSTNGTLLFTLTNPSPAFADYYGSCVTAVGSDKVLIGAFYDAFYDQTGVHTPGAAYLFSTNGALLFTFTNPAPADYDYFGFSIAAVGSDKVLIGAARDDTGATDAGTAYLFNTNGVILSTFVKPIPIQRDDFGWSVAAVGSDKVLIGAQYDDIGTNGAGAAYLFSTNGTLLFTFTNPAPAGSDHFGISVMALGADKVLITANGSYTEDGFTPTTTKVAYLFTLSPPRLVIQTTVPGQATISWASGASEFILQETLGLSPPSWTNSPSGATNPVTVPATSPTKFYRIFKP